MEKLIKAGHLRRYVKEVDQREEQGEAVDRVTIGVAIPSKSKPTINYILGCPSDDQYQSKCQQKRLLKVSIVKARINAIHIKGSHEETKPIDGPISFPPINPKRNIMPHYDAMVLTLYINDFDVHRVLVDPSSAADLLQLPAFKQMKPSLSMMNSTERILSGFKRETIVTLGVVTLPIKVGLVTQQVLLSIVEDLGPYNAIMGQA